MTSTTMQIDASRVQAPEFRQETTRWADVSAFLAAERREDGVHVIGESPARQLEILLGGEPFESSGEPVLVIFSGAITEREKKVPPFFSGSGLAASTGHAFIAISDPGIELSGKLAIAWYAGSAAHNTTAELVDLLGPLSRRLGTALWLVGGSAGGYAALAMGHALPGRPSVFTWNPQTDILEYSRRFVVDYLSTAYPDFVEESNGADHKQAGHAVMRRRGHTHSHLEALPSQGPGRIFYLQNATDSHFRDHCLPYLRAHGYTRFAPGIWRRDRDHVIWVADVAPGHTPPSRDQLINLLGTFTHSEDDVLTTVRQLESVGYFGDSPERRPEPLSSVAAEVSERSSVRWDGTDVTVTSELPEGYGAMTWTATVVDGDQVVESSPVRTNWGTWTPTTAAPGRTLLVALEDGFGDTVMAREFAL